VEQIFNDLIQLDWCFSHKAWLENLEYMRFLRFEIIEKKPSGAKTTGRGGLLHLE
jgi:hypothetical protein